MSDTISRQEAIDAVNFGITYTKVFDVNTGESKELFKEGNDALKEAVERLKELPSAQPEPYGQIKPCPFCGWGTIVNGGFLNYRCQCNACGATTKGYPTWEMAIEAWNRRAER